MKTFICIWGEGYTSLDEAIVEYHAPDFFTTDRGYDGHDIQIINNLEIAESVNLTDCGHHTIVRTK